MIFCYSSAGRQRRPHRSRIRVGPGGNFESRVRSMRLPFKHVPSLGARIVFRPFRAIPRRTAVTSGLTRCYRISNPSIQVTNTLNTSYVRGVYVPAPNAKLFTKPDTYLVSITILPVAVIHSVKNSRDLPALTAQP